MHAGLVLQRADDAKQVLGGGVAVRSEHAHQALLRNAPHLTQALKAYRRVDIGPQRRAAVIGVALQLRPHRLAKQRLAEGRIAFHSRPHRVAKILG